jgi:hypothetical protein
MKNRIFRAKTAMHEKSVFYKIYKKAGERGDVLGN